MDKSLRECKKHDVSHVKDESYYQEAELMQKGWGKTLKCIDKIKDKVAFNKEMLYREFAFTLYGNCYCSHCIRHFEFYLKSKLKINVDRKKMFHDAWSGIFKKWVTTEYNISENLI